MQVCPADRWCCQSGPRSVRSRRLSQGRRSQILRRLWIQAAITTRRHVKRERTPGPGRTQNHLSRACSHPARQCPFAKRFIFRLTLQKRRLGNRPNPMQPWCYLLLAISDSSSFKCMRAFVAHCYFPLPVPWLLLICYDHCTLLIIIYYKNAKTEMKHQICHAYVSLFIPTIMWVSTVSRCFMCGSTSYCILYCT